MPTAGLRHDWIRSGGRRIEEKGVFSRENFFRKWFDKKYNGDLGIFIEVQGR